SRRSLEIMERLGALNDFMAKGLPWTDGRSFYGEVEVFRFSMPHDAQQKLPPMINLQQYYIEQFLVDAVARVNERAAGLIDIRWATQIAMVSRSRKMVPNSRSPMRSGSTARTPIGWWPATAAKASFATNWACRCAAPATKAVT